MHFLQELKKRNPLLYWFGWYNFAGGIICILLLLTDHSAILGVNQWVKPAKFFFSVGIMIWTMNWLLYYLDSIKKVRIITWIFVITMFVENAIITLQAARGERSHFNVSNALNGILFSIMGTFIILFALTCIYMLVLYVRQKTFPIPAAYLLGIRLGLLLFILFSFEGGIMVGFMGHTIGGKDGGPGLPFVNWSTLYGDLRVSHFFGLHSLQVLPLAGYYLAKNKTQMMIYAGIYLIIVMTFLIQALYRIPLLF